jgi:hypothetical protein
MVPPGQLKIGDYSELPYRSPPRGTRDFKETKIRGNNPIGKIEGGIRHGFFGSFERYFQEIPRAWRVF